MTSTNPIDLLTFALSEQRAVMTDPTGSVTVEVTADGSIVAIRLSETGHHMTPAMVAELIMSLHTAGLAQTQKALEAALSGGETPANPEPEVADSPAALLPQPHPTEQPSPDPSAEFHSPAYHLDSAPSASPEFAMSAEPGMQPSQRDEPHSATIPVTAGPPPTPRTEVTTPAQDARPRPRPEPTYADDPADEDEYFRTFSVFEYDDHHPRGRG